MRDPHVAALNYRLVAHPGVEYSNPPPVHWETNAFRLNLETGSARLEMKEHFASVREARNHVEPLLRAWEIHTTLVTGRPGIRFEFDKPEVIDRNPPKPGEPQVIHVTAIDSAEAFGTATVTIFQSAYPSPPQRFYISPDVETMWARYMGFKEGREPLGSMGYACLTLLEASAGGRERAAAQYGISGNVLSTIARLVTKVGEERTVRKFTTRNPRPHTPAEVAWIEAAIRALILRAGEWAADPVAQRPTLTMADLPNL